MNLLFNYLKIIRRQMQRNQLTSFINITGLTLGFAVTFFIVLFVINELTYESFHNKADRIHRVTVHYKNGDYNMHWARVDADWVNNMPEEFPEVAQLIRFQNFYPRNVKVENSTYRIPHAFSTDAAVFEVFDFKLLEGNPKTALASPKSTVLTVSTAQKLFGNRNPMGKELSIMTESGEKTFYKVTGIMHDLPKNTHLPVNMLTSFNAEEERVGWAYTYILLNEDGNVQAIEDKIPSFIEKYMGEEAATVALPLQSLPSIHLESNLAREIIPNGNPIYLYLFSSVGLFILMMSVINFINLNTAKSIKRLREIGVRKALGSSRNGLKLYFYVEVFFVVMISIVLSLCVVHYFLPQFQQFISIEAATAYLLPLALLLTLFVSGLAGYYPAFILSKTHIITAVKSKQRVVHRKSFSMKNLLVAVQLILCLVLISAAFITRTQFSYLVNKNLGLEKDQVLAITNLPSAVKKKLAPFKHYLEGFAEVKGATTVMQVPSDEIRDAGPVYAEGKVVRDSDAAPVLDIQVVDDDFLNVMKVNLLAGRTFKRNATNTNLDLPMSELIEIIQQQPREYILNATALKKIGWKTPQEALGKQFSWKIGSIVLQEGPIVGVIEDFHQESLKNAVDPLVLINEPIWVNHLLIKVEGSSPKTIVTAAEQYWQENFSDYPIEYAFLDDLYNQLYQKEQKQLQLIYLFSSLAIFIAFLGIYGLISYALKTREKEITIRKVLGASTKTIVLLLSENFFKLTLIGVLVGIPLTWWVMNQWLQNFTYRVDIHLGYFLTATLLITSVLITTILIQMQKLKKRSITETLRAE